MPPKKKNGLKSIASKLKKDRKNILVDVKSEPTGTFSSRKNTKERAVPSSKKLFSDEKKLKNLMDIIVKTPNNGVLKEIDIYVQSKFIYDSEAKRFFNEFKWNPPYLLKEFAEEYLEKNPEKGLYKFYDDFILREDIREIRTAHMSKKDKEDEEANRRKKIAEEMFGKSTEEIDILEESPISYEKPKIISDKLFEVVEIYNEKLPNDMKISKLRDFEYNLFGNVSNNDTETYPDIIYAEILKRMEQDYKPKEVVSSNSKTTTLVRNPACIRMYKDAPWVGSKVEDVYITTTEEVPDDWEEINITPYIHEDVVIVHEGEVWYKANNKYYELQCNIYAKKRIQSNDVLSLYDIQGNLLKLKVGYKVKNGFIVQGPELFRQELKHIEEKSKSRAQKIQKILDEQVTNQIQNIAINELAIALNKIAPGVIDYHKDGMFVQKAVEAIESDSKNVKDFAEKLGELIVYFNFDFGSGPLDIDRSKNTIFMSRVKGEYYLPEILVNLSPSEKLPEIFDDPKSNEKEKVAKHIRTMLNRFVNNFAEKVYVERNPLEMKSTRKSLDTQPNIKVHPWRSSCVNKEDVKDIPDSEIVYYNDGKNVYCLSIKDLVKRFADKNYNNPVSGKKLGDKFIKRFNEVYHQTILQPKKEEKKEEKIIYKVLAPGLMNKIKREIRLLKSNKNVESEISDWDIVKGFNEGVDIDEEYMDYDDKTVTDKSFSSEDVKSVLSDQTLLGENGFDEDYGVSNKKCTECGKIISGKGLSSIKYKDNKKEHVQFCNQKCFENHDDWPKQRRKRNKKNSKKN